MNIVKQYFECDCGDFDHSFRVAYFEDDRDYMYISIHLRQQSLFRRIIAATKYVFGHRSKYGDFDEILLNKDDAKSLVSLINTYVK